MPEDDWRTGEEVDAAAPAEDEEPAVVCTYGGNRVSAVVNSNEASADFLAGPATLHTARTVTTMCRCIHCCSGRWSSEGARPRASTRLLAATMSELERATGLSILSIATLFNPIYAY